VPLLQQAPSDPGGPLVLLGQLRHSRRWFLQDLLRLVCPSLRRDLSLPSVLAARLVRLVPLRPGCPGDPEFPSVLAARLVRLVPLRPGCPGDLLLLLDHQDLLHPSLQHYLSDLEVPLALLLLLCRSRLWLQWDLWGLVRLSFPWDQSLRLR